MIDELDAYGRQLIASLTWMPDWVASLILLSLAFVIALIIHRAGFRLVTTLVSDRDLFWRSLVSRTEGPGRLAVVIFGLSVAIKIAPLNDNQATLIQHLLSVCFIILIGWLAITALHIWTTVYLRRFKLDAADNLLARKHQTQLRILQRVAVTVIGVLTIAAALMSFDEVRQYGVSLLASAGAAGLVIGLALQPMLKNLVAGIQLAITQPIRLDDAVIVEGEWGNVEEITSTYVVVRLWDWRRMVLPLAYFIEQPFQNWTREGSSLIGTVMLYVDYTAPLAAMREHLKKVAEASPIWDRQVVNMQVTDFKQETMEIRMLVSAGTAGRTFDLRCVVREEMISWLQKNHPTALPRRRAEIADWPSLRDAVPMERPASGSATPREAQGGNGRA